MEVASFQGVVNVFDVTVSWRIETMNLNGGRYSLASYLALRDNLVAS